MTASGSTQTPLVELQHLTKHFSVKQGVFARGKGVVHAVEDVSLVVNKGETLGIVGESGCGKTTTARLMVKLLEATSGRILFEGEDITDLSRHFHLEHVGNAERNPALRHLVNRVGDGDRGVAENVRSPRTNVVDIVLAIDVLDATARGAANEKRLAADVAKCPHR